MADVPIILRPIVSWPGEMSRSRKPAGFSSTYTQTIRLLCDEARHLKAREVIVQLGISDDDLRIDGDLRAKADVRHPGVIVSMETKHGPMSWATDRFDSNTYWGGGSYRRSPGWHNNLRAIALGLEALRKVDRYGMTNDGAQYTGFKALGSGIPMGAGEPQMTLDEAARILGGDVDDLIYNPEMVADAYRSLAREHHPDAGGDPALFAKITEARDLLLAG